MNIVPIKKRRPSKISKTRRELRHMLQITRLCTKRLKNKLIVMIERSINQARGKANSSNKRRRTLLRLREVYLQNVLWKMKVIFQRTNRVFLQNPKATVMELVQTDRIRNLTITTNPYQFKNQNQSILPNIQKLQIKTSNPKNPKGMNLLKFYLKMNKK